MIKIDDVEITDEQFKRLCEKHGWGKKNIDWEWCSRQGFLAIGSDVSQELADEYEHKLEEFTVFTKFYEDCEFPFKIGECWKYIAFTKLKGHVRPHFGGERPVDEDANVVVYLRDGTTRHNEASQFSWDHTSAQDDILKFIEL